MFNQKSLNCLKWPKMTQKTLKHVIKLILQQQKFKLNFDSFAMCQNIKKIKGILTSVSLFPTSVSPKKPRNSSSNYTKEKHLFKHKIYRKYSGANCKFLPCTEYDQKLDWESVGTKSASKLSTERARTRELGLVFLRRALAVLPTSSEPPRPTTKDLGKLGPRFQLEAALRPLLRPSLTTKDSNRGSVPNSFNLGPGQPRNPNLKKLSLKQ